MFIFRMPVLALYVIASWLILLESSSADDCIPEPLLLRIDNVTIPGGYKRRGVSLNIGGPGQDFSFIPMWSNNNTFLYGPKCDRSDYSLARCQVYRGGLYNSENSTTEGTPDKDYIPLPEPWSSKTYSIFTETLNFANDFTLQKFPLAHVIDHEPWGLTDYATQNIIGLASGSTLISSLKNAKRIMSRAIGIYWGLDGVGSKDQGRGSLVLGGYDRAKTYGDGLTQLLTDKEECASKMVISIQDLVLNFRNGTDVSLFPKTSGGNLLQACLLPERPVLMDMPRDPYFNNFEKAIENGDYKRSGGIDFWNIILHPDLPIYDGDLTFKLDKNLQITIPNHQLIVPERNITNDGSISANSSASVLRINALQEISAGAFPILGRYFLTSAYVMVNEDANEFTIWQANPTTSEDLVAVDENNKVLNAQATCTVQPTASAQPGHGDNSTSSGGNSISTGEPINDSSVAKSGISTGAIVGIVVGVIALLLVGIGFFFWRRKKKRQAAEAARAETQYQEATRAYVVQTGNTPKVGYPSQGFPHFIPQEMSSEQQPKMKPVELP